MTPKELDRLKSWAWHLFDEATTWTYPRFTVRAGVFIAWVIAMIACAIGVIVCAIGSGETDLHLMQWVHTTIWIGLAWPTWLVSLTLLYTVNEGLLAVRGKRPEVVLDRQLERLSGQVVEPASTDLIKTAPGSYDYD